MCVSTVAKRSISARIKFIAANAQGTEALLEKRKRGNQEFFLYDAETKLRQAIARAWRGRIEAPRSNRLRRS